MSDASISWWNNKAGTIHVHGTRLVQSRERIQSNNCMGRKNRLHMGMPRKQKDATKETLSSCRKANNSIQQLARSGRSMVCIQQNSIHNQQLGRLGRRRKRRHGTRKTNRRKAQSLCKRAKEVVDSKTKDRQQKKSELLETYVDRNANA